MTVGNTTRSPLREVVATPNALYLLGTALIGRLPTAMATIAIVQLVRLQGGSFELAGLMTAAYIVAQAAGAPALGRWIDKIGQSVVLLVTGIGGAAAFVGMAYSAAALPAIAVVCSALGGLLTPPLEPALRSLWPRLVREGAPLKAAFSLDAGAQELVFITGPLLTVLGISAFGATGNVLFCAALGLGGTLAFAANSVSRKSRGLHVDGTAHVSPMRSGAFRRVVAFQFGIGVPLGVLVIAVTAVGEQRGLEWFAGWALAANAVGALIGATVTAVRPFKRAPEVLLPICGFLLGVGYLPLAIPGLPAPLWLALAVVAGLMLPPTLGQVFDLVHRTSPVASLNEANAWAVSALNVGAATGTVLGGMIAGLGGAASISLSILMAVGFTWALSLVLVRRRFLSTAPSALK